MTSPASAKVTVLADAEFATTAASSAVFIEAAAERTAADTAVPLHVNVRFTDEDEIRDLNKRFRGIDSVTDVLSFPAFDDVAEALETARDDEYTEDGLLEIGDIAICIPRAQQQADDLEHSLEREIMFLALHGMLHLLGYDHETSEDEEEMTAMQRRIMRETGAFVSGS